jgi:hypothetical protein
VSDTNLKLFFKGKIIGSFPPEHASTFLDIFTRHFPGHQAALISKENRVQLIVYPVLSPDERDQWDELYEEQCRELNF